MVNVSSLLLLLLTAQNAIVAVLLQLSVSRVLDDTII